MKELIYKSIAKVLDLLDPKLTNLTQKIISAIAALIIGFLFIYPPGQKYMYWEWGTQSSTLGGVSHDFIFAHDSIAYNWLLVEIGIVFMVAIILLYFFESK